MNDDVIVCRCEEVSVGEIRKAIQEGARDVAGVKRRTRAGMGLCQGRTCERTVIKLLAEELHLPEATFLPDTVRTPITPTLIAALLGERNE